FRSNAERSGWQARRCACCRQKTRDWKLSQRQVLPPARPARLRRIHKRFAAGTQLIRVTQDPATLAFRHVRLRPSHEMRELLGQLTNEFLLPLLGLITNVLLLPFGFYFWARVRRAFLYSLAMLAAASIASLKSGSNGLTSNPSGVSRIKISSPFW